MPDSRPLILIVDDQPLELDLIARALHRDYAVQMAASGMDALALARRQPGPSLILLDVMMPGLDGYAVCLALKGDPLTAEIPVIFVTVKNDAATETAALAAGAVDFIHKPINPEVVRARVQVHHELMEHRRHLETLVQTRTLALAEARDAAESADRAKTAFLRNASHELLTPLGQITGMGYLLDRELPAGPGRRAVEIINRASRELLEMVQRLLDFARLEAGELRLEPRAFAPRELLGHLLNGYEAPARAKGLGLEQVVAPAVPDRLIGDDRRLHQILDQLLDNAVKFTGAGRIRLAVEVRERTRGAVTLDIRVEDTGVGMTPEVAAGLFRHFRQGDDSLTRPYPGLGLGLALCRRLVTLMGGEIRLDGVAGQGTTASVRIPLGIADDADPAEP